MKPEAQRIAIAEACGLPFDICMCGDGPDSMVHKTEHSFSAMAELPDYLNDLNAMHEAEALLHGTNEQYHNDPIVHRRWKEYECHVIHRHGIHASAAQRAEAFLRTIGKWTDS